MRKVLLWVGVGLGVLVAVLVALIAVQPAQVHVERSRVVAATPADIWPYVADLRGFVKWSPWEDRDPNQVSEFSEPSSGVGAWYAWKGNEDVGSGKMTITASDPQERIEQDLVFIEPFASEADVLIALEPTEAGTKVTWGFDSDNDFMGKAFSLVMDMDELLGPDFDKGLESLATLAEADAAAREEAAAAPSEDAAAAGP